ncbi:MAG: DNA-protecting protein DprA, partial [Anaerolineae bacterium]|nr:DNA-protecting protein DprA [Anaerolineae bacterium]
ADITRFEEQRIRIILWDDAEYPASLLALDDAPPVLFARGRLEPQDSRAVAIVGTRTPTPLGAALAEALGYALAQAGWTVISGLALGIDGAAHMGALRAGGRTLAVLGCGLNRVYPPVHRGLAHQIVGQGALLSEVHPEATVSAQQLMARNRLTSGLSRAVLVIEAAQDSGSLSTGRRARAQGRAVFAVAGGDTGCEELLRDGATPILPGEEGIHTLLDQLEALAAV